MPPQPRMTFEELVAAIRRYVRENLPRRVAVQVRIWLDDGGKIQHPIGNDRPEGER